MMGIKILVYHNFNVLSQMKGVLHQDEALGEQFAEHHLKEYLIKNYHDQNIELK